jgi:hypothetical protein
MVHELTREALAISAATSPSRIGEGSLAMLRVFAIWLGSR